MAQNEAKDAPKRLQEAPKRPKKVIPNRKTKKGPNQDDLRAALDLPGGGTPSLPSPQGRHLGPKTAPKPTPNRSKIEAQMQDDKKTIQDALGPVLARSWVDLGPILESILAQKCWKT